MKKYLTQVLKELKDADEEGSIVVCSIHNPDFTFRLRRVERHEHDRVWLAGSPISPSPTVHIPHTASVVWNPDNYMLISATDQILEPAFIDLARRN
ncbi:hypothetical protein K2O51_31485 (plasmid) [Cupriavidus pinatubonensis]|uniref:hypothetical protein n=1 Tax=Cupriavidus pinatubonensis TaxID=248026 RepID=UPI001C72CCD3|nr:hypothetical protein [Cupriavidus pinatubonensis]QYY33555.1 hypothetical protein K2O51_31485 [Cupriavidus pinatubonensis]